MQFENYHLKMFKAKQWKEVVPCAQLVAHEIHLWRIEEAPPEDLGSLLACAPLFEFYLGNNYSIIRNENGKPIVYRDDSSLHPVQFNISHTKEIFAIAFVNSQYIGLDIEDLHTDRPWRSLAKRYFAPEELAVLEAADPSQQLNLFFQFWTLKEAMIKCLGLSIFTGISRAHFSLEGELISLLHPTPDEQSLRFFHHKDTHYFSIALSPFA